MQVSAEVELLDKIATLAGLINRQKNAAKKQSEWSTFWPSKKPSLTWQPSHPFSSQPKVFRNKTLRSKNPPTKETKETFQKKLLYLKKGKNKILLRLTNSPRRSAPVLSYSKPAAKASLITKRTRSQLSKNLIYLAPQMSITFPKEASGKPLMRTKVQYLKNVASQRIKQSILTIHAQKKKAQQCCLFFTKFGRIVELRCICFGAHSRAGINGHLGKCNNQGTCKYLHDPSKVAVCRKFLKGECFERECLLQHKISKESMPVCSFFLRGICVHEKCPYSHVNVNHKAAQCPAFLKGYCPDGIRCKLKHSLKRKKEEEKGGDTKKSKKNPNPGESVQESDQGEVIEEEQDFSLLQPHFE